MKKTMLFITCSFLAATSFSQISVGIAGNYTAYKGDFGKSTPGAQIRVGYSPSEKINTDLLFTYGFPIKQESVVTIADNFSNTISVPSEIRYKFKTIAVLASYKLIGDDETSGSLYGQFGGGLVLVSYDEKITGSYNATVYTNPLDQIEKTNENGFTINLGLGGEYKFGAPSVFAEAGIALPANQVNNQFVENVIPAHFTFNLGVRFSFGGGDY
jgi:hypothetical protein